MELPGLLRDCTPELDCLFTFVPQYLNRNTATASFVRPPKNVTESSFASYFAGLFEGDGTIFVPKRERSDKGHLYYPNFQLSFSSRDLPLALLIQKELGFGNLQKFSGKNAYNFTVSSCEGLLFVFSLLNGNLRTRPKHAQFTKLSVWLRSRFPELDSSVAPLNTSPLFDSAWLSGFIDAGGHFAVRMRAANPEGGQKYARRYCGFELLQSHMGGDSEATMLTIADALGVNLLLTGGSQYRLRTSTIEQNRKLVQYLSAFPLFSVKYLDYLD